MNTTVEEATGVVDTADDLDFDIGRALQWFPHTQDEPYVLVHVSEGHVRTWVDDLQILLRRCYITDALVEERAAKLGVSRSEILAAKFPDPGSTMAGDFGEILVYLYQAAKEHPQVAVGPKKWRLKQDRTKPAPHSDVVQFILPCWPTPSPLDVLLCSEVKTKSTDGTFAPIKVAIEGSTKDRTSRLARTLVWLRERALIEDLGDISIAQLERFINTTDHPAATKRFQAVAVICSSLVAAELSDAPTEVPASYEVVVISVPQLYQVYNAIFDAARQSAAQPGLPALAGRSQ